MFPTYRWLDAAPASHLNGTYSLFSYSAHALAAIHAHADAAAAAPGRRLFLYLAFQDVHGPSEAPERFLEVYDPSTFAPRRKGLAQVRCRPPSPATGSQPPP